MAVTGASIPRWIDGAGLQMDQTRDRWVILSADHTLLPDESAIAILRLIDGTRTLDAMVDDLVTRFDAPRTVIAADVTALIQDLVDRRMLAA